MEKSDFPITESVKKMKHILPGRSILRRIFVPILLMTFVQLAFVTTINAQGWGFTFQLLLRGDCGADLPYLSQPFSIPWGFPTLSECNAIRQMFLSVSASEGGCTVSYTCSECTGSDIPPQSPSSSAPGSASVTGLTQGTAFFSPHESAELQRWLDDTLKRMDLLARPGTTLSKMSLKDVPLTRDNDFNKYYIDQTLRFEKGYQGSAPVDLTGAKSIIPEGKVVPLLRGPEEEKNKKIITKPVPELKDPEHKPTFIEDLTTVTEEMKDTKLVTWATVFPVVAPIAEKYLNPTEYEWGKKLLVKAVGLISQSGNDVAVKNALKFTGSKTVGLAAAVIDVAESLTQIYSAYKVAEGEISLINVDADRNLQTINKLGKMQKAQVARAKSKVN